MASAAGLLVAGWATAAKAAPFELEWSAPEACPSREAIVDATYASLGESNTEASPELFVRGEVVLASGGVVVTLVLEDAAHRVLGERVVRVDKEVCAEIVKPTSVVLAMMIAVARPLVAQRDEPRELAESPPAPEHVASAPPASRTPLAEPVRAPTPSAPEHLPDRLSLGGVGVTSVGALPGVGLGFGLRASYVPRSTVLLGLEATFEKGGSVRAGGGEVGFQLFSGAVRVGLPVARTARFELIPTAGARIGLIRTLPVDFASTQNDTRLLPSIGPGVLLRANLGRSFFLEGLVELDCILLRDRFQVLEADKLHRIHRPEAFGGRLSLGLAYELR